ncbi:response regulator, partial [Enterobacter hormaechei]|nr:response regulator [Enterobacter hormaechei]
TAASDMQTCSHAMRSGAFDYLIKPVFFQRLHASLERFMRFIHTVQQVKVVDQHALDRLFNLPASEASITPSTKGIEPQTLERIKRLFAEHPDDAMSVEEVVENVGISKTTGRRYLEYCVESGLISIEMLYGNIGHPRRLYRKAPDKP